MNNASTKVSISMPADLYESANDRRLSLRYRSFSAYVQHLVEQDIDTGGNHVRVPVSKEAVKSARPN
jgi:hypothetical protein